MRDTAKVVFTVDEAANTLGVSPDWVLTWIRDFKTSSGDKQLLSEEDMNKLSDFASEQRERTNLRRKPKARGLKAKATKKETFLDDGQQENFTVAQIASMWQLSRDTIQRLFQDEAGVVTLGEKNPRGKRRRVTLRIPRAVMQRVKKSRSNPV